MKKVMVFMMLLLSTSMAMAQFGDIDDILKNAGEGGNNGTTTTTPTTPKKPGTPRSSSQKLMLDDAIKDGFYLVKQEYRLEDVNVPGSRYNREGSDCFGYTISFMLKLKNGIITSQDVMTPWENDENFEEYKGGQYVPHISRTSYLQVGRKEWKVAEKMLDPTPDSITKEQDIVYVTDKDANGFSTAKGSGNKEALVIWLSYEEKDEVGASYTVGNVEVNVEKGKKTCNVLMKSRPDDANYGIVVVPDYSIGRIDLNVLGVIDLRNQELEEGDDAEKTCKMNLLRPLVGNTESTDDNSGLSATENPNANKKQGKSSNKDKK